MYDKLQNPLTFVGRILLAALFLPAGIGKLTGFAGTVGYISSVGLPMPQLGAALALIVEIARGVALVAGFRTRTAALAGRVYSGGVRSLPQLLGHAGRSADDPAAPLLQEPRRGGRLLTLAAWGAGAWSVDARRAA